mgnify:CR=1 FL=1
MIKSVFLARVALPVLLSLSACAVHEPYQRPETRLPPAWTGHNPAQTAALGAYAAHSCDSLDVDNM